MLRATLGRTGLEVNKDGFGALPIQRISVPEAGALLGAALDGGINFFDTARGYSNSEEKIGLALGARRDEFVLATKTPATTAEDFWRDSETSLGFLKTDHIDIYQFHTPPFCPLPGDGTGLYEAMEQARAQGKIRFIGITNHRLPVARQAVESGLYDTLQYPFNYLSGQEEQDLVRLCAERNVGFIAMKALSGGLLTDVATSRAWLAQYPGAVPIWGLQRQSELDALFAAMGGEARLTDARMERIEADRKELSGSFCRSCGYCMPCPVGIQINQCARMGQLLRRAPAQDWLTEHWQAEMKRTTECVECGQCAKKCPYGLNPAQLIKASYADYLTFL